MTYGAIGGEQELPDEAAVAALLLVEAVQAQAARPVTHHQPQAFTYPVAENIWLGGKNISKSEKIF